MLGMDLELEAAEHPVGGFSRDLLGRDRVTGERVIVENQLEGSDHGHLGQILTYAAGTNATNVVWLATSFRPEHRAALEWLNERTNASTRFFAVQLQVVRIGSSPAAPLLTLVVRPNDWEKVVRASTSPARRRGEEDLFAELERVGQTELIEPVRQLLHAHLALGDAASLYWGEGRQPSVTAVLTGTRVTLQPWTVSFISGQAALSVNYEYVYKAGKGLTGDPMSAFAQAVQELTGVRAVSGDAEALDWRRRPSVPAGPALAGGGVDVLTLAVATAHAAIA
ncbi:hypothetical protein [Puerhibacterium sp. TATVAM-FAB25]|uniref:hypothetical protein n=1 Tax=Puerhibacterium sp. TATVAM-FAB25 TaxID=3093699 RepID=UPI00397CA9E6